MPVYLIRAGEHGPVKIGFTSSIKSRLAKMQTDNHEPLVVLRLLVGGEEVEADLHCRFQSQRRRGDWFEFCHAMLGDVGHDDFVEVVEEPAHPLGRFLHREGMTVAAFADAVSVSAQAIHRYLNGERVPHRNVMARITAATNGKVKPSDFYPVAA